MVDPGSHIHYIVDHAAASLPVDGTCTAVVAICDRDGYLLAGLVPRRPLPSAPNEPHMLENVAGEFFAALNILGTMLKAALICESCSPGGPVTLGGSMRVIAAG